MMILCSNSKSRLYADTGFAGYRNIASCCHTTIKRLTINTMLNNFLSIIFFYCAHKAMMTTGERNDSSNPFCISCYTQID